MLANEIHVGLQELVAFLVLAEQPKLLHLLSMFLEVVPETFRLILLLNLNIATGGRGGQGGHMRG